MTERPRLMWHFALAAPAAALAVVGSSGCRSATPHAAQPSPAVASDAGPPTLRLYLVTDLAGALEPCGCTKDQLGGLDHFGAWVRKEHGEAPASSVVAAGPLFFMDSHLDPGKQDQDRAKADAIAGILGQVGFVAFAPGANDWAAGAAGLGELAKDAGAAAIVDGSDAGAPFVTTLVRAVDGGSVKVGFVGYGQPEAGSDGASVEAAVRHGVDLAKAQGANLLVALAAVGRGEAKRIADAIPELAAVVVGSPKADGDANTVAPEGERVGDVLVAQAANHLQSVGVLDFYVRGAVAPGAVLKFADGTGLELESRRRELRDRIDDLHVKIAGWERDKNVAPADLAARRADLARLEAQRGALDAKPAPPSGSFFRYGLQEIRESLGKDPAIDARFLAYYKAVDEHNRVAFAGRVPPPAAPGAAKYVGDAMCSSCHSHARTFWNGTAHAHAYESLAAQFKEFNLDCVACHVTGYEKPSGSTVTHVDNLRNVQCEACHGPGSKHAANPLDTSTIVTRPSTSVCLGCHHPPHVEQFDAVAKMNEILGPGHGRPLP